MLVLLADDTEINRWYLGEALAERGAEVVLAVDGPSALALARARRFDLLVLDQRMPGLFGDQVLEQLRRDRQAASHGTPALAIGSELDVAAAARLLLGGFSAVLAKPLRADLLWQACLQLGQADGGEVRLAAAASEARAVARLDDAQATRALGNPALVPRLRALLRAELVLRRAELGLRLASREAVPIRELLHQLLASCALCGAPALADLLREFGAAVQSACWLQAQRAARSVFEEIDALLELLPESA